MEKKIVFTLPITSYQHIVNVLQRSGITPYSIIPMAALQYDGIMSATKITEESIKKLPNYFIYDENNLDAVTSYLKAVNPDFVFYGSDHFLGSADQIAALVCNQFANSTQTSKARENKAETNKVLARNGFIVPKEITTYGNTNFQNRLKDFKYPIIVKPTLYSGANIGLNIYVSYEELSTRLFDASEYIIQEVIWDKECKDFQISYSVDGFAVCGQFYCVSLQKWYKKVVDNKIVYCYAKQLDPSSEFCQEVFNKIIPMLRVLGLYNGFFHPEFIDNGNGLVLIDLNPRLSGGYGIIDRMIDFSLGQGVVQAFVNVVYKNMAINSKIKNDSWLMFLYGLSNEQIRTIQALASFIEILQFEVLQSSILLLGHKDVTILEADFNYCRKFNLTVCY